MSDKEYIIFCDESDRRGKYYSNFYGGLIIGSSHYEIITAKLNSRKIELNLHQEVKWEKVTAQYLEKYQALMKTFFEEVAQKRVRVRIMFRQNAYRSHGLSYEQIELEYFLLYYQFVKHAFGLEHVNQNLSLRIYFDKFPDTAEKIEQFKGYLLGLTKSKSWQTIDIKREDIAEVNSHNHVLLQCLDVVLGAMAFRLNDKHKEIPTGSKRRGKRTIAKEKLYRFILSEIRRIRPNFNIGVSTKTDALDERWLMPYLHWAFVPQQVKFDARLTKSHRKKEK